MAGNRSILDTLVLPRWGDSPKEAITYAELSAWIASLCVDGSQAGTGLSASRIRKTHQLVGAVFKYALRRAWRPRTSPPTSTDVLSCQRPERPRNTI